MKKQKLHLINDLTQVNLVATIWLFVLLIKKKFTQQKLFSVEMSIYEGLHKSVQLLKSILVYGFLSVDFN